MHKHLPYTHALGTVYKMSNSWPPGGSSCQCSLSWPVTALGSQAACLPYQGLLFVGEFPHSCRARLSLALEDNNHGLGTCDLGGVLCHIVDAESLEFKSWGNYVFIVLTILNEALIVFNSVFDESVIDQCSLSLTNSNRSLHPSLAYVYSNQNKRNKKMKSTKVTKILQTPVQCTVRNNQ